MAMLDRLSVERMGFSDVGDNVLISDRASFYNCSNIKIGNNVRIDDFCILSAGSGGILIGNHIHIAAYTSLIGGGTIIIMDFGNVSSRVSIFSSNDDYSGSAMTGPMISAKYTNVTQKDVTVGRHVIVGCGSVILPGVTLAEGAAVGALSLIRKDCKAFGIYSGVPAKLIAERMRDLLDLEQKFLDELKQSL